MSGRANTWAYDQEVVEDAPTQAVLVNMADHAGQDGEGVYPSVKTIARQTRLSERTVQKCRKKLADLGLIEETGHKANGVREFRLCMERGANDVHPTPVPGAPPPRPSDGQTTTEPSVEPTEVELPPTPAGRVWAYYLQTFGRPIRPLPAEEAKIIAEALRAVAGREEDLIAAIDGNRASSFHQGDNDRGKKYNSLSQILKGKRGGKTTLEQIEMFMAIAEEAAGTGAGSSATPAQIGAAKRAVLDGITYPGDEHVAKRGEDAVAWLASEVGIRWDETARKWVSVR